MEGTSENIVLCYYFHSKERATITQNLRAFTMINTKNRLRYTHRDETTKSLSSLWAETLQCKFSCLPTTWHWAHFFDLSILHVICKVDVTNLLGLLLTAQLSEKKETSLLDTQIVYKKQWSSCFITDFTGRNFIFILYPSTDHGAYQNI